jgi:hypothetical protein
VDADDARDHRLLLGIGEDRAAPTERRRFSRIFVISAASTLNIVPSRGN